MPLPKNKLQTILVWLTALLFSVIIAALTSIHSQPLNQDINWRLVWDNIIASLLTTLPLFAVGIGIPRLGSEERTQYVTQLGTDKATDVLKNAANGIDLDYGKLADIILKKDREWRIAQNDARLSKSTTGPSSTEVSSP